MHFLIKRANSTFKLMKGTQTAYLNDSGFHVWIYVKDLAVQGKCLTLPSYDILIFLMVSHLNKGNQVV